MRLTFIANILALASLASPAVQAQSSYTWAGPTLLSAGLTTNGCNLRIPSATHNGSLGLSNIFVTVSNRGTAAVRITADVELSGNNSRKTGSISGVVQGNSATASMQAMTPGEFKAGGKGLTVRYGVHPTPFGDCLLAATERGVCDLRFLDDNKTAAIALPTALPQ